MGVKIYYLVVAAVVVFGFLLPQEGKQRKIYIVLMAALHAFTPTLLIFLGVSSVLTLFSSAQVSMYPRLSPRLTSTPVLRRLLSLLPQAMTSPLSFTM